MDEPSTQDSVVVDHDDTPPEPPVVDDVLVEEVSIDGMCGVY